MSLDQIIRKQRVLDTPHAQALAERPAELEERFLIHVATHIGIADLGERWDRMLRNLERKKSAVGLIYADTGYGKTSTAAALWKVAEDDGFVAVPPFRWEGLADMLVAAHAWVRYRLEKRRPEAIPPLQEMYQELVHSGLRDLAVRYAQKAGVAAEAAERLLKVARKEGRVSDVVSPNRLVEYLRQATMAVQEANFKGLLLLPDEFQLFEEVSADVAKNLADLKDLLWSLYAIDDIPLGCVVSMMGHVHAQIQTREPHMLARFNKPDGSVVNLEAVYGQQVGGQSFPDMLWNRLAVVCDLSAEERKAISDDVLLALGQFLAHNRSKELFSGPRSVIAAFRQAALHFSQKRQPYAVFDFFHDYKDGRICFSQQEAETAQAYAAILSSGAVGESEARRRAVQLLCIMPAGVPRHLFERYGVPEKEWEAVVEGLLARQVITKVQGPTLLRYKDDRQMGDQLVEILKQLRDREHNVEREHTHTAAVRAFANYLLPHIFTIRQGAARTGWGGLRKVQPLDPVVDLKLEGSSHERYPDRSMAVHVGTEAHSEESGPYRHTDLYVRFVLHTEKDASSSVCQVGDRGLTFHLDARHPFNPERVPPSIAKLQDVFLPNHVTPLLLLEMLDFFDRESTQALIEQNRQQAAVDMLRKQVLNELTAHFFSEAIRTSAAADRPGLERLSIGKDFVERALRLLIAERYPDYYALATTHQWQNALSIYVTRVREQTGLGIRRGAEAIQTMSGDVPGMFGLASVIQFKNTYYPEGVYRDLLRVDETDTSGKIVKERIEVSSSQKPVAVWLIQHPLERQILSRLEETDQRLPGGDSRALPLPEVLKGSEAKGYTSPEVEALIEVLAARGLIERQAHRGQEWIYLLDTKISLSELAQTLEDLEQFDALARKCDLNPEWSAGHKPDSLRRRFNETSDDDELAKDALRRDLHSAAIEMKAACGRWLTSATDEALKLRQRALSLKMEVPALLEKSSDHPTTDFSTLLFMDIRTDLRKRYERVSAQTAKLADRIKAEADSDVGLYRQDKQPSTAISTVVRLRSGREKAVADIALLEQERRAAEEVFTHFQQWRAIARRIADFRENLLRLADVDGVLELRRRLDDEQGRIKHHLGDRNRLLDEVLLDHEHFARSVADIEVEFTGVTENRRQAFERFSADIQEKLLPLLDQFRLRESYNPHDEVGALTRIRQRVVEALTEFTELAANALSMVERELLKPIEVFNVDEKTRQEALELQRDVRLLKSNVESVRVGFRPEDVDERLDTWVATLIEIRERSNDPVSGIQVRHARVQDRLRSEEADLTPNAKALLRSLTSSSEGDLTELIIALRGRSGASFDDAEEILRSLVELYRSNWVNIRVSPTLQTRQPMVAMKPNGSSE